MQVVVIEASDQFSYQLGVTSDAPTIAGKHVTSNTACARTQ